MIVGYFYLRMYFKYLELFLEYKYWLNDWMRDSSWFLVNIDWRVGWLIIVFKV